MPATIRRSVQSVEYLDAKWRTSVAALVAQPVDIALVPVSRGLLVGDWKTAAWETAPAAAELNEATGVTTWTRHALILAGPGTTIIPARGRYGLYTRLTSNPEVPVIGPDQAGFYDFV